MGRLSLGLVVVLAQGCAGFKAVERGDWRRVYKDPAQRSADAPQELITRDKQDEEQAAGNRRAWEPLPGWFAPQLAETPAIGLKVGEVVELLVDEGSPAELFLDGNVAEIYWNEARKRDEWKNNTDVTRVESSLFVRGVKPGKATLRLVHGQDQKDVPITVK
jgi:hypothetical protein